MKKIFTLLFALSLITNASLAATSYGTSLKNAVKQDFAAAKSDIKTTAKDVKTAVKKDISDTKTAVKKDIENEKKAQASTAAAKKAEKIKQIDSKLTSLNKEMASVKADKNITETERTLKTRTLQRQIDFYNNQKKALQ